MMAYLRKSAWGLILALMTASVDQLSKWSILNLLEHKPSIPLTSFFELVLVFNRGISFGMFNSPSSNVYLLIAIGLVISLGLVIFLIRADSRLVESGLGFILGGAIGNIIDRFNFSAVVDFLYFHWNDYGFPAFNIADSAITFGVILILLDGFLIKKGAQK